MKKIVNAFIPRPFSQREFYIAVGVILLFMSGIPYAIISFCSWAFFQLTHIHGTAQADFFPVRRTLLVFVGAVCVANRLKILLFSWKALRGTPGKILERIVDSFLTFPQWLAFVLFVVCCMPALGFMIALPLVAAEWRYTLLVNDMIIYVLAIASHFIFGVPVRTVGLLSKAVDLVLFTHASMIDYFLWPFLLGMTVSKIVAGKNLEKLKYVVLFFKRKCIMVDRETAEGKAEGLEEIQAAREAGITIATGTNGRDRDDEIKPFQPGMFRVVGENGSVAPVLILGAREYRQPLKGAISKKPGPAVRVLVKNWWNPEWILRALLLPWQNSARVITVIYMDPVQRLPGETNIKLAKRLHGLMSVRKKKEMHRLLHKPVRYPLLIWCRWKVREIERRRSQSIA